MRKGYRFFTKEQADAIKKEYENGSRCVNQFDKTDKTVSIRSLAQKYGVSAFSIQLIVYGRYNESERDRRVTRNKSK